MREPERYLRRATRLLWGRRRAEVREELEAHILERSTRLQALGLTPREALDRTLRELGEPARVALAFGKVHTMNALLLALVATSATVLVTVDSRSHPVGGSVSPWVLEGRCENGSYFVRPRDSRFEVVLRDGTPNGAHVILDSDGKNLLSTPTSAYRAWLRAHVKGCESLR